MPDRGAGFSWPQVDTSTMWHWPYHLGCNIPCANLMSIQTVLCFPKYLMATRESYISGKGFDQRVQLERTGTTHGVNNSIDIKDSIASGHTLQCSEFESCCAISDV